MNKKLKQGAKALAARTFLSNVSSDNKDAAATYDEFMEYVASHPNEIAGEAELTTSYVWAPFENDDIQDVAEYMENLYDDALKTFGD